MDEAGAVPSLVVDAKAWAAWAGFRLSSEDDVGRLLAVLVVVAPVGGCVLELGTGAGVGTAWIVSGLVAGGRADVEVVTVESSSALVALAQSAPWPAWVRLVEGDVLDVLGDVGAAGCDLVFADAQGGKWEGLDRSVAVVRPGGVLVVDDMKPQQWWTDAQRSKQELVRRTLLGHPDIDAIELDVGSGVILCTKR